MLSLRPKSRKSDTNSASLPQTPESGQLDSVFPLEEEELEDPLSRSLQMASSPVDSPLHGGKQPVQKSTSLATSLSLWRLPEPDSQEESTPMDSGRESDHESDAESIISVRSSSKESQSSTCSSGGAQSSDESPNGAVKMRERRKDGRYSPDLARNRQQDMLRADAGYCTLPHKPRNGEGKAAKKGKMPTAFKRISTIATSKKRKSVSADISSPAHASSTAAGQDNASWSTGRRQNAIRRSKLSSTSFGRADHIQPIIHESSYAFQIQQVSVIFKGTVKMEVVCRGGYIR